jgi:hypothetical protein
MAARDLVREIADSLERAGSVFGAVDGEHLDWPARLPSFYLRL